MGKHIADQPRERTEGTRIREFTRLQREQGAGGPHRVIQGLQRRPVESEGSARRAQEFLKRHRQQVG